MLPRPRVHDVQLFLLVAPLGLLPVTAPRRRIPNMLKRCLALSPFSLLGFVPEFGAACLSPTDATGAGARCHQQVQRILRSLNNCLTRGALHV